MNGSESILNREVKYLREGFPGLSHYMVKDPTDLMLICPKEMDIFTNTPITCKWNCTKYLPSSPDSLIKVLLITIL